MYATLSDRIGRRPVFIAGNILCAIGVWFFLWSITTGSDALILSTGVLLGGVVYSITNAVWPATYAERFPTQVRLSGMAIGTQFGFAVAGFAPLIESAVIGNFGTAPFVVPAAFATLRQPFPFLPLLTVSAALLALSVSGTENSVPRGVLERIGRPPYSTWNAQGGVARQGNESRLTSQRS